MTRSEFHSIAARPRRVVIVAVPSVQRLLLDSRAFDSNETPARYFPIAQFHIRCPAVFSIYGLRSLPEAAARDRRPAANHRRRLLPREERHDRDDLAEHRVAEPPEREEDEQRDDHVDQHDIHVLDEHHDVDRDNDDDELRQRLVAGRGLDRSRDLSRQAATSDELAATLAGQRRGREPARCYSETIGKLLELLFLGEVGRRSHIAANLVVQIAAEELAGLSDEERGVADRVRRQQQEGLQSDSDGQHGFLEQIELAEPGDDESDELRGGNASGEAFAVLQVPLRPIARFLDLERLQSFVLPTEFAGGQAVADVVALRVASAGHRGAYVGAAHRGRATCKRGHQRCRLSDRHVGGRGAGFHRQIAAAVVSGVQEEITGGDRVRGAQQRLGQSAQPQRQTGAYTR